MNVFFITFCIGLIIRNSESKSVKRRNRRRSRKINNLKIQDKEKIKRIPRTKLTPPRPYFPDQPTTAPPPTPPPIKYRRIKVNSVTTPQSYEMKCLLVCFIALIALSILVSVYLVFKKDLERFKQRSSRLFASFSKQ